MKLESNQFDDLPFSKLFKDYCSGEGSISTFFETKPQNTDDVHQFLEKFEFSGDRNKTVDLLESFNKHYLTSEITRKQVQKFHQSDSLAVVTGQQVTLYGGPLYTIYKTITAILKAQKLEKELNRPVIPVFWLADEDHDIQEVSAVHLPGDEDAIRIQYQHKAYENAPPASSIQLGEEISAVNKLLMNELDETDFTADLLDILFECYSEDNTFGKAFGDLLMKFFGKHGLVLAGSFSDEVKEHAKSIYKTSVKSSGKIADILDETTYNLKEHGYHDQVQVHSSNLFYLDSEGQRIKIQLVDDTWSIPSKKWTQDELIEEVDNHPERFSPNVFLRPVLQDHVLPVAGYVGGPGEIAYYAQMKGFYGVFDQKMPVIIPRFSVTIFESAIDRILEKLPFKWGRYMDRIEDLEKSYVDESESLDIEKLFGIWRSQVDELSRAKRDEIGEIDPSLKGSVGKAKAIYFSELDKLKGKVYRSIKEQENIQLSRIERIKSNLFPNNNLQEREVAFIYFLNKYGLDFFDSLIRLLHSEEPFSHKKIHL